MRTSTIWYKYILLCNNDLVTIIDMSGGWGVTAIMGFLEYPVSSSSSSMLQLNSGKIISWRKMLSNGNISAQTSTAFCGGPSQYKYIIKHIYTSNRSLQKNNEWCYQNKLIHNQTKQCLKSYLKKSR